MQSCELEPILTREQAAKYLGICPHTLVRLEARGQGPNRVRVGRSIRYRASDLRAFLEANAATPMVAPLVTVRGGSKARG